MKIGVDIRSTLKKTTGIGRYTLSLINAIAKVDRANEYYLYSKKKILDFKRRLPVLPGENFFHCVDYFGRGPGRVLPKVDLVHTSSYDLEKPKRAKFFVTIHDVVSKAYPYGHTKHTIEEIDRKLRDILDEADGLIADSYNTKSDLTKFYKVPDSKISVIYPGVSSFFSGIKSGYADRGVASEEDDFILFVGTLEPRKNIEGLIKAFGWIKKHSGITHKLYIVGMKGWMFENIFKAYEESDFKKDIIFKGYIEENYLKRLYQEASVFVYPSFYEGFGFPIIEAFSAGVPVVTSKTSSCGEIGGSSALLIDPADFREIADAILKLITDENLKRSLVERGVDRAKEFTWAKTAESFVRLFTQ